LGSEETRDSPSINSVDDNLSSMRILINGLGAIGVGKDGSINAENHLSIARELGFEIAGGVDIDPISRENFKNSTGLSAFGDLKSAASMNPDVVVIASNEESHLTSIKLAIENFPDAILVCEKPLGGNANESQTIYELVIKSRVKCFVNYTRQFSNGMKTLKENIKGDLLDGTVIYNQGLIRSCSHYIRLCIGLFGVPVEYHAISSDKLMGNPSFELIYADGSNIKFLGVSDSGHRVADFYFSTNTENIHITEAMNWKILECSPPNSPQWERDLRVLSSGDFSGGLSRMYQKILNSDESPQDLMSECDTLPMQIIDEIRTNA